ncbi:PorT family protein [Zhouia spongiae]|uniref:PorT family protein n=1 Tax=Zhouia spongiae TaxID=2202721 RepID=A0ABY3YI59_9FLAO|nr:porin family protein [Zhouia spongiae]UNY97322.1 PorT family protein [Zhouia spongiae]
MKKHLFCLLFLCAFINKGVSQLRIFNEDPIINLENFDKQPVHWGYFLGFNQYDFKVDYNNDEGDILIAKSVGFNVGLIGNLRINDYLDLRFEPGLYYNQRDIGFPGFTDISDYKREVKSTYIHFPLLLKVSTKRLGNFKPYVVGGVSGSINLSSEHDSQDDNYSGTFRMKKNAMYYELGFGLDFYLPYFKFSPSIRGVFALTDELIPDNDSNSPWTSNLNGMYSRGVFVNFTFE